MTRASPPLIRQLLAVLLALLLAPFAVHAQETSIDAKLVVEGPVQPGTETRIAIRFTPVSDEWHGYWSNPGDAGKGMEIEWDLPEGVSVGTFRYPPPETLVQQAGRRSLMNHIFEGEYAVVAPLRVAPDAQIDGPFILRGTARYLACTDRICVPQTAQLSAVDAIGPEEANARFAQYQSALAAPLDRPARFALAGDTLRLAIPLPATLNLGAPHVFIENRELVDYAATQTFARDGDMLLVQIPLSGVEQPPKTVSGILRLGDGTGLAFDAREGNVATGGEPIRTGGNLPPWWVLIGAALLGGLMLNIMPCVFPILSRKALSLAKAGGDEDAARKDALAYTAGVVLACVALGAALLALRASGEAVGWAFQLQNPAIVVALFLLASALTANFLGAFEIPGFAIAGGGGSQRGSFATGLLAAFVATPCTGPFMAAALGAALVLPVVQALALFAALGLGLALPFLLLGFVPALRKRLPRPGKWMEAFRRWMALPMGLTALALAWLLWRMGGTMFLLSCMLMAGSATLVLICAWSQRLRNHPYRTVLMIGQGLAIVSMLLVAPQILERSEHGIEASILDTRPFSESALAEARATDRPVFVYFTADWCVTCKVNESVAIETQATADAFDEADVVVLRGDWTRPDPAITAFLTQQGVAGVPLYLWYAPGARAPQQLPQVLSPRSLADLADRDPSNVIVLPPGSSR